VEAKTSRTFYPDGPYEVGVMVKYMKLGESLLPVTIWYPAKPDPQADNYIYAGELQGSAVMNARSEISDGPYPLILFSHGMAGCGCQSVYYTENLASFGYVVAAPDHSDSAICHIDGPPDITFIDIITAFLKSCFKLTEAVMIIFEDTFRERGMDFSYRPKEASATLDQVLAWNQEPGHPLYGIINPKSIGMTGHSLGGYTTLMVGGVPIYCKEVPKEADCKLENINLEKGIINPCCSESFRSAGPFGAGDDRVKAILPMGPAVFFPELEQSASEIKIPIMIITSGSKRMEVPWMPIRSLYDNAPPPKYLVRIKGADHLTVSDLFREIIPFSRLLPGFLSGYEKKAQAYKDYSVAFFNLFLKGDDKMAGVLDKPSNKYVELWEEH
jgi:predicted dienelactone hydrolase